MNYVNDNEKPNFEKLQRETSNHTTTQVPNNYYNKVPTCIILSMEERIDIRVKKNSNKRGRNYSRSKSHL